MSGIDWQNVVALALVAAAIMYLASRIVAQFRKRKSGCATGCASCPVQGPANAVGESPTVSLEQLATSAQRIQNSK